MRCVEPVRLLESRGYEIEKRNVQKMTREQLESLSALFESDEAFVGTLVHERKRDDVAGLSRGEIVDRMLDEYTYINRPVAVRGTSVAAGPLKHNRARYDELFG